MAFSFEKFVQKSTRGLFAFIVVIMIVPLVLWGYMGKMSGDKDGDEEAGIIKTDSGPVKIYKSALNLSQPGCFRVFRPILGR